MRKAFVTFLGTPEFLPGVWALSQSLKATQHKTELLVLLTGNIPRRIVNFLKKSRMDYKLVAPIINPCAFEEEDIRGFRFVYTKLRMFELLEYDKIVFVDADMVVCQNVESLFDRPHFSAVVAGGMHPDNEGWKDLNSGLMVVEPSLKLFEDMLANINHMPSISKCDQGFLHSYFPGWRKNAALHLPHGFNVPVSCLDTYCKDEVMDFSFQKGVLSTRNLYVIHFWGALKPWQFDLTAQEGRDQSKYVQAMNLWWHYFSLD